MPVHLTKSVRIGSTGLLAFSLAATLALPAAAQSTTGVRTSPDNTFGNSEQVAMMANGKYAVVVGGNSGEKKVRSLRLSPLGSGPADDYKFDDLFGGAAPINLGMTAAVAVDVAAHPTQNYAAVILAESNESLNNRGALFFVTLDANGNVLRNSSHKVVRVGVDPENVAISPNGNYAIVTNKAEGTGIGVTSGDGGAKGTISIIDLSNGPQNAAEVQQFQITIPSIDTTTRKTRKAADPGPEGIAISADSSRVFVSLTENNALVVMDINASNLGNSGVKTLALPKAPCGKNGPTGTATCPIFPEGIATFRGADGNDYLVTANADVNGEPTDAVSLVRLELDKNAILTANLVASSGRLGATSSALAQPRFVKLARNGDAYRAFVTLENSDEVVALDIVPGAASPITEVERFDLVEPVPGDGSGEAPEGIALRQQYDNFATLVTANGASTARNVSVIGTKISEPLAHLADTALTVSETAGVAELTVALDRTSFEQVQVSFAIAGGNAEAGSDYELAGNTITFAPGVITGTLPISITNNAESDGTRTLTLELESATNAVVTTPTSATITITDDEKASVAFAVGAVQVNEDDGEAVLQLVRAGVIDATETVTVTMIDGSAVAGEDYTGTPVVVSFNPQETIKEVRVPLLDDAQAEGTESFTLTISSVSAGLRTGTPQTATVTIAASDTPIEPGPQQSFIFLPLVQR